MLQLSREHRKVSLILMEVWLPPVDKNKEPGLPLTAFVHMNTISSLLCTIKWYPTETSPIIIYKPCDCGCGRACPARGAVIYTGARALRPWGRRRWNEELYQVGDDPVVRGTRMARLPGSRGDRRRVVLPSPVPFFPLNQVRSLRSCWVQGTGKQIRNK